MSIIRWRAVDDSRLVWRSWNEPDNTEGVLPADREPLSVVYFLDSDDTHLMNSFGTEIIRALQEQPRSVDEIIDILVERFLPSPEHRVAIPRSLVEHFLHQMSISGLVFEDK